MSAALHVIYIVNCLFLILVVLLQAGRGGGLSDFAGGGGGATAAFGSAGSSSIMQRITVYSAGAFMVLSIVLALLSSAPSATDRGRFVDDEPTVGSPEIGFGDPSDVRVPEPPTMPTTPTPADELIDEATEEAAEEAAEEATDDAAAAPVAVDPAAAPEAASDEESPGE